MKDPWRIYDDLLTGIPEGVEVVSYQSGFTWTRVRSSENSLGMAMTIPLTTRDSLSRGESLVGMPLKEAGALVKSWNFVEAAIGLAAINSWYNQPQRAEKCGFIHPCVSDQVREAFDVYFSECQGKKVAVIGHFPFIEQRLRGHCQLSVLERSPSMGDYPDTSCEYILPEQGYVFITACTLVNKTLPRLLELSAGAKVVLVGPSTPLAPVLFDWGIFGLSGFVSATPDALEAVLCGTDMMQLFQAGRMVDQINPARHASPGGRK